MSEGLLTEEEAAAYLGGLAITTLKNLVRAKRIGHVKVGRKTAFKTEQLDTYIDAHTVAPQENPWGLTDAAVQSIRGARSRAS